MTTVTLEMYNHVIDNYSFYLNSQIVNAIVHNYPLLYVIKRFVNSEKYFYIDA